MGLSDWLAPHSSWKGCRKGIISVSGAFPAQLLSDGDEDEHARNSSVMGWHHQAVSSQCPVPESLAVLPLEGNSSGSQDI